jgi:hypothetical protein
MDAKNRGGREAGRKGGDAGEQLAHQGRLSETHDDFHREPGDEQQNEQDVEQFHGFLAGLRRLATCLGWVRGQECAD